MAERFAWRCDREDLFDVKDQLCVAFRKAGHHYFVLSAHGADILRVMLNAWHGPETAPPPAPASRPCSCDESVELRRRLALVERALLRHGKDVSNEAYHALYAALRGEHE